jgi:hypothetical protein
MCDLVVKSFTMKIKLRKLCALGLAVSLWGVQYVNGQVEAGNAALAVPTNVPNIKAFVAPPAAFDPTVAPVETLQRYGFPPRPDIVKAPEAYHAWLKAVSGPQRRLEKPVLVQTRVFNGPVKLVPSGTSKRLDSEVLSTPSNSTPATSSNWSGFAVRDAVTKPFAKSTVYAYWIVPVAQHAFGNAQPAGGIYSSQWVGIDGYGSQDVLQAGTEVDSYLSGSTNTTFYGAWIEWYPFSESLISNFFVAPGNEIFVEVWNTSATVGNAYVNNLTTQQTVSLTFNAPSGTTLIGDSAEWVMERPGIGDGLATLTNYVACPFNACAAVGSVNGGTRNRTYGPGINQTGAINYWISMLDSGGSVISVPSLVGTSDIWFRNTGSALKN